jgi:hypothetical protein
MYAIFIEQPSRTAHIPNFGKLFKGILQFSQEPGHEAVLVSWCDVVAPAALKISTSGAVSVSLSRSIGRACAVVATWFAFDI